MSESMNSYERIKAALEGNPVDHVPFSPFLAYVWEFFPAEIREKGQLAFHQMIGADPLWRGAPCPVKAIPPEFEIRDYHEGNLGIRELITPVGSIRYGSMKSESGNTHFLVEHPLKREEDYRVQLWIEENTRSEFEPEPVQKHFAGQGREGLSIGMLIPRGKSAFQSMIESLVGTEELNYALMDFPDTVEALWNTMVANDLKAANLAVKADYDYFLTWEDSSTQNYSPNQYQTYIASEISQWCQLLDNSNKRYIQHACGHLKDILPLMQQSGAYGVESISPAPTGNLEIDQARQLVGSEFAIIGGIEPVKLLNCSLDDLATYTKQVIDEGKGGPFVLANSDSCPPGVTVEKFKLIADISKLS